MNVSLILTCLNEQDNIKDLLHDLLQQNVFPKEMVIVDAGSVDGTIDTIQSFEKAFKAVGISLIIKIHHGVNIAKGRNLAIEYASGDVIAVTDAGCRLNVNWLKNILVPFETEGADLVGGFYESVSKTHFQKILSLLTVAEKPSRNFLPSSRSIAFKKYIWSKAGGYPEWLYWGEDTYFNSKCLEVGAVYRTASDAIVYWEVRRTWKQLFKQYQRYALGDGLARRKSISLVMTSVIHIGSLVAILFGYFPALLIVPIFSIGWVLSRKNKIPLEKLPYSIMMAVVIQFSRAIGYTQGFVMSFFKK